MYNPFEVHLSDKPHFSQKWGNLSSTTAALTVVESANIANYPILMLTSNVSEAQQLFDECHFFNERYKLPIVLFPDRETLPYDHFSPYQDLTSERLKALQQIQCLNKGIIISAASTIAHKLPPAQFIDKHCFAIKINDEINIEQFRLQLSKAGYVAVSQVIEHGEYCFRGSIIDLFPMGTKLPIRIDLFDTTIDSIRWFEPEDQRSKDKVSEINLLPAHEYPLDEDGITCFRQNWRQRFSGNPNQCPIYQNLSDGIAVAGIEYYLPLFFSEMSDIFSYLPENTLIIKSKHCKSAIEKFWKEIEFRYQQYGGDITRPLLSPNELFFRLEDLFAQINQFKNITLYSEVLDKKSGCFNFNITEAPDLSIHRKEKQPLNLLANYLNSISHKIIFTVESAGRREALIALLKTIAVHPTILSNWHSVFCENFQYSILISPLRSGFILTDHFEIISESQLFGEHVYQHRRQSTSKYQQQADGAIRNLLELNINDAIVHLEHGVGRYQGLQTLTISGHPQEFLLIHYDGDSKLYVPVTSLHLIHRYGGADPNLAPLHRLGTEQWSKAKQKAAEKIRDVASELLEIYAKRAAKQGFIYQKKSDYTNFASAFRFEETPDQAKAISDVLADMNSPKTMDRLVCGDVGFGKTEVAMRAAFVAIENEKQVAVLVPTTLLAHQHFQTFVDRFADWPIRIEVLSRFKTVKETETILLDLKLGKIDIVIGTHKLIKKKLDFARLGLLIIDEEHRFGVQQKETIKALRANIDILTLTATPIPRTLNLSLSGIRDLSLITTPPARRLAVKTFVNDYRNDIIQEAILRELQRGGQIYFLHNEVDTIEMMAEKIQAIVPEIKLAVAHGQMRERKLEDIMSDFYHHRFNLLLCTTIIESGIDVPTANTIIINRADKLGLAQLHQLRGRVGRSHHQAYAYLLIPEHKKISNDAKKRLEAIAMHEDLGAGFMLANHDLEIRGAGEFLGQEQSGQIQSIGFDLYMELLNRAVNSLKAGKIPNLDDAIGDAVEIDVKLPALIPDTFIADVHTRLIFYKRIASAQTSNELKDLQIEMIDRFGLLPDNLKNLFEITELKLSLASLGIKKLEADLKQGKITFSDKTAIEPQKIIKMIQIKPKKYKLLNANELSFFFAEAMKPEILIDNIRQILTELH